ncbi:hypothetical protein BGZ54_006160, partial [Gamsiella multidivaricata]
MAATVDRNLASPSDGVYTFRIQGEVHHFYRNLLPENGERPKFAQISFYDSTAQLELRKDLYPQLEESILRELQTMIEQ